MPNSVLPFSKTAVVTHEISATVFTSSILMAAYLGQFRKKVSRIFDWVTPMYMKDFQLNGCGKDADSIYCNPESEKVVVSQIDTHGYR